MTMNLAAAEKPKFIGLWEDKTNNPETYFLFEKNKDFRYRTYNQWSKKFEQYDGVWELGLWETYDKKTGKKNGEACTLTIYVGNDDCCYTYKFIGKNFILKNLVPGNRTGGICSNRVLVPSKE